METCCWENEQYETRTKQTVNQAHRFIVKRFRWLKCWERILFRIICLFNTRPRRGLDRSRTIRNLEKTGPGAAPAEFHFHGFRIGHYRCHFDIATALSQADRAFRYGRPRRNLLFRTSTFRTRYRKRPCYRNESGAVGKRQTKYAPTLFHILSIILCRIRRCYKDN